MELSLLLHAENFFFYHFVNCRCTSEKVCRSCCFLFAQSEMVDYVIRCLENPRYPQISKRQRRMVDEEDDFDGDAHVSLSDYDEEDRGDFYEELPHKKPKTPESDSEESDSDEESDGEDSNQLESTINNSESVSAN
ncbi:hypothetical protein ACTA71_008060 [Dictyostelium dimigraforme]